MNINFLEFDAGWLWFIMAAYGLTQITEDNTCLKK
jgi:hypothetical protein